MRHVGSCPAITKAVILLILAAASGWAGVIYTFVGTGLGLEGLPDEPVAFQLTVPSFIAVPGDTDVTFSCAQLDSNTNCAEQGTGFWDDTDFPYFAVVTFFASDLRDYPFFFPAGSFDAPGVYTVMEDYTTLDPGELTVTETPEPATLLPAMSGLCLYGFSLSRRRKA